LASGFASRGHDVMIGSRDAAKPELQEWLAGEAKVVKAFNTIGTRYFVDPSFSGGEPTMLIAGNDADAKATVGDALADFSWSSTFDIGGIEGSRELEASVGSRVRASSRHRWDRGFARARGIGGIEGSRELGAICIAWVKIGGSRDAWDHGFGLLTG
jgi:predicted dinucleotide-binding enzyme